MKKNYNENKAILELSETIEAGLTHIQKQLNELRWEEAFALFSDAVNGIYTIEQSLQPILKESKPLSKAMTLLRMALDQTVTVFEKQQMLEGQAAMRNVLNCYNEWRGEIKKEIGENALS